MMRVLNKGCEPDNVCLTQLKQAQRSLEHARNPGSVIRKRKFRGGDDMKPVRLIVLAAVWRDLLSRYTQGKEIQNEEFENNFTRRGEKGYKEFHEKIIECMHRSVENEDDLSPE
ncbi:unnamed protein product [Calypogeia fissa]